MEDLGEAVENFVETFSCTEELSSRLSQKAIPATHANLLTSSALYGYLFAAVGSSIVVYSHAALREGASPVAIVDLGEQHVTNIYALALGAYDTITAQVTTTSNCSLVILNISALAAGKIHALPSPSGAVSAFCVSDVRSNGPSQVLATLKDNCVELNDFTADGTTLRNKITTSNARCVALSPQGDLLAVGTERGRIIIYNTKTGETCATIVEVESGWVPFSMHFVDSRSVLVSYNCDTEVRHVVWTLSLDGTAVAGHSPLGELCLTFQPFDEEEQSEAPIHPMMTYISLHEWGMCVIGSSMSSDVEIIRKTDSGWEVWKFDEGKSPTLPTDDNDDDTYCVGLAFDLNNTELIPGLDAASPKINPMPRIIVYTSDSLLLPFALIDYNPGVKCEAVDSAMELPPMPINLRSIQSASTPRTDAPSSVAATPKTERATYPEDPFNRRQRDDKPSFPKYGDYRESASSTASTENEREEPGQADEDDSIEHNLPRTTSEVLTAGQSPFASTKSVKESKSLFSQQQAFAGMNSFLDNFSFKEPSAEHVTANSEIASHVSCAIKPDQEQYGISACTEVRVKPKISLAPSFDAAKAEAEGGNLFGLLKSILTEMSEELKVSAEAERVASQEITAQKDLLVSSITELRKQLTELLQVTRNLFQNEATLRNSVSNTLSKVLSLSREYEKMSLEYHVKEADGFSQSLRAEEKELDDKIASKEAEVARSISAIEDRLNTETEIQTRRMGPIELMHQVYSSLSLQGIRINRVRRLLTALSERMDNQDKGERLSHLGLSLARLEKLKINDEEVQDHSKTLEKGKEWGSVDKTIVRTPNVLDKISRCHTTSSQGDDTHLLPSDVRAVMRRLAMSGGRANISVTVPLSRTKTSGNMKEDMADARDNVATSFHESNRASSAVPTLSHPKFTSQSDYRVLGFSSERKNDIVKAERPVAPGALTQSSDRGRASTKTGNGLSNSGLHNERHVTHVSVSSSLSENPEVYSGKTRSTESADTDNSQTPRSTTSRAHGVQSAPLPPKKPLGQPPLPSSTRLSTAGGSLLGSKTIGDNDLRGRFAISLKSSSSPQAKVQDSSSGKTGETSTMKERSRESPPPSGALFSTSGAEEVIPSRGASGLVPGEGRPSCAGTKLSVTEVTDIQKPTKSSPTQFASLLPGGSEDTQKPSISAPAAQCARLPPDDDEAKPRASLDGSRTFPGNDAETGNKESMTGLFAVLPPAVAISKSSGDKQEKSLASQAQEPEKAAKVSELFAALPPDLDMGPNTNASSSGKGRSTFLRENRGTGTTGEPSIQYAKVESLGTSDLFAALPPDDGLYEQAKQTRAEARFPFGSEEKQEFKTIRVPAVTDESENKPRADQPSASIFDTSPKLSTPSQQTKQFGSPFGALQQTNVAFGKASLFEASSTRNQSAPATNLSAPERQSARDGASSDESDEEPTRLEAGMDTSSAGGDFFGATSFGQGNKDGFGFQSKPDSAAGMTSFGQSSTSPFGTLGQGQPFGLPPSSQTQTVFESLAGSHGSVPPAYQTAQPTFGSTSSFGAASAAPTFGMESTFGAESQLGVASTFGVPSQLGITSTPVTSSNPTFGGGMPAPNFGESSFGVTSPFGSLAQGSTASGFAGISSASSASPFGSVAGGGGFGETSGGGSGFAALAGGQSGGLIFGNGAGPPAFTSAAFSQRRA